MEKSSTGLSENVAGLLCYVLGWISGVIFVILENKSKFVRFHAIQSIYVFGVLTIIGIILRLIPGVVCYVISIIVGVIGFILWVVLMVKAYQGEKYKIPWAGNMAEKRVK